MKRSLYILNILIILIFSQANSGFSNEPTVYVVTLSTGHYHTGMAIPLSALFYQPAVVDSNWKYLGRPNNRIYCLNVHLASKGKYMAMATHTGVHQSFDFGKTWKDGRRILGDGKTWRGLITGAIVGMTGGFGLSIVAIYANNSDFAFLGLSDFGRFPLMIPIIGSICFGALFGDITESFLKRRRGKKRGEDWIPFDQLDFIIGALVLSFIIAGILQIVSITSFNWFFDLYFFIINNLYLLISS